MKAQRFPHSVAILLLAGTLQLTGCGEETSSTAGPGFAPDIGSDFDEAALVANLTDNIISRFLPVLRRSVASKSAISVNIVRQSSNLLPAS